MHTSLQDGSAVIDLTGPNPVLDLTRPTPVTAPTAPASTRAPAAPARHRAPARQEVRWRARRLVSGLLLAVVTAAAVAGAVLVVVWRVSFTPVLSPSMAPAFGAGDLIVTRALDTRDIRPGAVIVLPLPDGGGERFVHRVTSVRWDDGHPVVGTKGDANAAPDPWQLRISSDQVPVVVGSVDRIGSLGVLTRDRNVRLALLGGVALLAVVGIRRSLR